MAKRKTTIEDVARLAGCSSMTVSRAINDSGYVDKLTRQRVFEAMETLNYRPSRAARILAGERSMVIGVTVPDIANPFFSVMVRGIQDVAWQRGYNVLLLNTERKAEQEQAALQLLREHSVDGVIVCNHRLPDEQLLPLLKHHHAAVVIGGKIESETIPSITWEGPMSKMIIRHLISQGRKHFALVGGPAEFSVTRERADEFNVALREAGHEQPLTQVFCQPTFEDGYEAALHLLKTTQKVDAILSFNDMIAVGAIRACDDLNLRVPEEIAVVGWDDIPLATLIKPRLTTVRQSLMESGMAAMELILEHINGDHSRNLITMQSQFIVRESA